MIHIKFLHPFEMFNAEPRVDRDFSRTFQSALAGPLFSNEQPPFRDKESLRFIEEIDHGSLVDGDWYSYISPFGRTCMHRLCSGTQFALACIHNSRHGVYTCYENYGEDIYGRLNTLGMDILLAYDIWTDNWGVPSFSFPDHFIPCVIENFLYEGQEVEAVLDIADSSSECYTDANGNLHISREALNIYRYDWKDDLVNIFNEYRKRAEERNPLTWDLPPAEMSAKEIYHQSYRHLYREMDPDEEADLPLSRKVLFCMHECVDEGIDKYPRILYIKRFKDGHYTFSEECPVKYPNLYEMMNDVIELYDPLCEDAFAVALDIGCFHEPAHFREAMLWQFHDNGKELTCYSGHLGLKKLVEFAAGAFVEEDGSFVRLKVAEVQAS